MWRGYRGNRLPPCFPTDVYDRNMATDIWLILPYVIAWEKALPYEKDLSHTWYIRVYTKNILGFILNTLYTSVYDGIYQVYTSIYKFKGIYIADMQVYASIHHCDQHISIQDFVERIVMLP
jgi:hypothetical protein